MIGKARWGSNMIFCFRKVISGTPLELTGLESQSEMKASFDQMKKEKWQPVAVCSPQKKVISHLPLAFTLLLVLFQYQGLISGILHRAVSLTSIHFFLLKQDLPKLPKVAQPCHVPSSVSQSYGIITVPHKLGTSVPLKMLEF